ncbi:MAG: hypothetical protein ACREXW_01015 [Gammaproteobacteria bacterium]
MTADEIDCAFRGRVDDKVAPFLWSAEDVRSYRSEAIREYCRRVPIVDNATASVCQINVTANQPTYALQGSVLFVNRVKLASQEHPLRDFERDTLDEYRAGWETETGTPEGWIEPMTGFITLVPIPVAADKLLLEVGRLPLEDIHQGSDEPEIQQKDHFVLLDWMCHLAYLKQDADAYDQAKSDRWAVYFTNKVGPRLDSRRDLLRREMARGPRRVRARY